jgi:GAF domain-containing protein
MFEDLSASLLELQSLLAETATFQGFLADLAGLAVRSFPNPVSSSVTLVRDGLPETVANSDDLAALADQAQYDRDLGPCLVAYRDGLEVTVVDLEKEDRFGGFPAQAATLGLRSLVALPLRSSGDAIGAFNLYSAEPGVFTDGSLVRARLLTAAAAGALEIARRMTEQSQLNEDLKTAMTSRRIIDQALGITMAKEGCDADTAFAQLRRQSQTQHRKLREIAVEIITETAGSPPVEAPVFVPAPPR